MATQQDCQHPVPLTALSQILRGAIYLVFKYFVLPLSITLILKCNDIKRIHFTDDIQQCCQQKG